MRASAGQSGVTPRPDAPTQQAWSSTECCRIEMLRKLDVPAHHPDQLTAQQQVIINFSAKAQSARRPADPAGCAAPSATALTLSIDVRPAVPLLSAEELRGIQPRTLPENPISLRQSKGLLDLNANLNSGNSQRAWIDGSNGDANFLLNDGVLVDANLSSSCAAASLPI
jgi:AsmA protein